MGVYYAMFLFISEAQGPRNHSLKIEALANAIFSTAFLRGNCNILIALNSCQSLATRNRKSFLAKNVWGSGPCNETKNAYPCVLSFMIFFLSIYLWHSKVILPFNMKACMYLLVFPIWFSDMKVYGYLWSLNQSEFVRAKERVWPGNNYIVGGRWSDENLRL